MDKIDIDRKYRYNRIDRGIKYRHNRYRYKIHTSLI